MKKILELFAIIESHYTLNDLFHISNNYPYRLTLCKQLESKGLLTFEKLEGNKYEIMLTAKGVLLQRKVRDILPYFSDSKAVKKYKNKVKKPNGKNKRS